MRLTTHTDYSLRTLIYLAITSGRLTPVGEVALEPLLGNA